MTGYRIQDTVFVGFVNTKIKRNMKIWALYLCNMTSLGFNMKSMSLTAVKQQNIWTLHSKNYATLNFYVGFDVSTSVNTSVTCYHISNLL